MNKFLMALIFYWPAGSLGDAAIPAKAEVLEQDSKAVYQQVYPHSSKDLAPRVVPKTSKRAKIKRMQSVLKARGYDVDETGFMDESTEKALRSFRDEVWLHRKNQGLSSRTLEEMEITFQPFF